MAHRIPISLETTHDTLARMRVYQLVTVMIAGQLYFAVCSIEAHTGEGYSRASGKDRARIFEVALGSVRESMTWYRAAKPLLTQPTTRDRLERLEEMRRLFLAIIPRERGRKMK